MSLGTYGSTLNDELNRLANGGTYPEISLYKDMAGAAQAWAAAESIELNGVTDLVGVLNIIYGNTNRRQWLDLAGICNLIAGTVRLEPAAALRQVGGAPALPIVTGGVLTSDDTYYYHTFLSTDNLNVENGSIDVEALIIGGGGGGGYLVGGGAGGVLIQSMTLGIGSYTATVGAGGAGTTWTPIYSGENSSFNSYIALGGAASGQVGGSASGANANFAGGISTPGQGNDGGPATGANTGGAGGGGAGAVGEAGHLFRAGGNGGAGILLTDWAAATGTGDQGYYAGGGGGAGQNWEYGVGAGGIGGGGNGEPDGYYPPAQATYGKTNTGGGGGGRYGNLAGGGGSGLVIVRYLKSAV